MGFKIQPMNLEMVDTSEATSKDRLIIRLTAGESETGQLVLRLCDHPEGRGHRFCLDSESHHVSLTEKLRIGGYIPKTGGITYFPHISLVGPASIGEYPRIEIYSDPRLRRRYILAAIIGSFDASNVVDLVQRRPLLASA